MEPAQLSDGAALQPATILVVDDDELVRTAMVTALQRDGYRVLEAPGPQTARGMLDGVTLCLCDVAMAEGSGLDFMQEIGSRQLGESPAFVMITGSADRELGELAIRHGAYGYLLKPYRLTELSLTVKNALLRREMALSQQAHQDYLEEQVRQRTAELRESQTETVHRLAAAVELYDHDTGEHLMRVGDLSAALAQRIGLPSGHCETIRLAAWLHDIGKIAVSSEIVTKPGPLTPEERRLMEGHADAGRRFLAGSRSNFLQVAAEIAGGHHERFDGTGYPDRLRGEQIPVEARIVAIVDVFDALISDRPYRAGLPFDEARGYIAENRGAHFDPVIVDAFLAMTADGRLPTESRPQ
jgi:putative two-component system response regulator